MSVKLAFHAASQKWLSHPLFVIADIVIATLFVWWLFL